jgi:hypothetical protein
MGVNKPVLTSRRGNNAQSMVDIAQIHFPKNPLVLDLTFGRGAFWRAYRPQRLVTADRLPLKGVQIVLDATWALPFPVFPNSIFDIVVIDPPYLRGADSEKSKIHPNLNACYQNNAPTSRPRSYHPGEWRRMMEQYYAFLQNASMVVKKNGLLVVKCMDDKENWVIRDLLIPTNLKLISIHVVTTTAQPMMRHDFQLHARKNHSYFLILRRTGQKIRE